MEAEAKKTKKIERPRLPNREEMRAKISSARPRSLEEVMAQIQALKEARYKGTNSEG
jgi:hypothetical protein